jgi:hypothetical protein
MFLQLHAVFISYEQNWNDKLHEHSNFKLISDKLTDIKILNN